MMLNIFYTMRYYLDRKSTRLNSSHVSISYAVFCLNKKNLDFPLVLKIPDDCFSRAVIKVESQEALLKATAELFENSVLLLAKEFFFFFLIIRRPPITTLFPYTTLFRSAFDADPKFFACLVRFESSSVPTTQSERSEERSAGMPRPNSYAVFCLKKKK